MQHARTFLASSSVKNSCIIDYVIPSNTSSVDLARRMAAAMGAPFIYPEVENLVSFDGSHLIIESSERWATAYLKIVDAHLDECIASLKK